MVLKKPKKLDPITLGLLGGADEFEDFYPDEMSRLGTLTAYWSLVEDSLCQVLAALLMSSPKGEAAFYSTVNHKARRDMVLAVSKNTDLTDKAKDYLKVALVATSDAADLRNALMHGLLKMDLYSGKLLSVRKRPVAKIPTIIKKDIMGEINHAIEKCELAVGLLSSTSLVIEWPNWPDDFEEAMKKGAAKKQKTLP